MPLSEREKKLIEIITALRREFDFDKIKKTFVESIGRYLNADMVYFFSYDPISKKLQPVNEFSEYRKSPEIPTLIGTDIEIFEFFKEMAKTREIITISEEKTEFIEKYDLEESPEEAFRKKYGAVSAIFASIYYQGTYMGLLDIVYREKKEFTDDMLDFLEIIRIQAGNALYQANLFQKQKQTAIRERTLRNTIETIRSTLDITAIKKSVVTEIGKAFDADRCFIMEVLPDGSVAGIDKDSEYLSSPDVKSLVGINLQEPKYRFWIDTVLGKRELSMPDIEKFIRDHNLQDTWGAQHVREYNVKSAFAVSIFHAGSLLGCFALHYTRKKYSLSGEDFKLARTLSTQAGFAIYQANLYNFQKQNAEKESLLREIVSEIKISQSLDEAYNYILAKLADIFNVSRSVFIEVPQYMQEKAYIKHEYLKDKTLPSIKEAGIPKACMETFKKIKDDPEPIIINDTIKNYSYDREALEFFKRIKVKSIIIIPLIRYNRHIRLLGIIAFCSTIQRDWKPEEVDLLKAIAGTTVNVVWDISKLQEIEEIRNTFMLTLAHDLQVPVLGEKKALEYINLRPGTTQIKDIRQIIDDLLDNNLAINETLSKLIDIYNYEMGHKKLQYSRQKLEIPVNNACEHLKEAARAKNIEVVFAIDKDIPDVKADRGEIERVLGIVLKNAIDYSPENSEVTIRVCKNEHYVITCISDKGPGFPPELEELVFKRYEMIRVLGRKIGAGLSLYLTKLIIQEHKGMIRIDSKEGQGTTFCIYLPVFYDFPERFFREF